MFLLILDSLGNSELFFILLMALIFFGPRKLPQLSRTLGKNLAEFRKASEDFKRTWEREVAIEESRADSENARLWQDDSITAIDSDGTPADATAEPESVGEAVARENVSNEPDTSPQTADEETINDATQSETPRKQDWL